MVSASVSLKPFELVTRSVIGYTPSWLIDHSTTLPDLSAAPSNAPSWSRSHCQATRVASGSGSRESEASSVTVTGAAATGGVTVAWATGDGA